MGGAGAVYVEGRFKRDLEGEIEADLLRRAAAARLMVDASARNPAAVDALADRLGVALDARVTVIDASGAVLGDSEVPLERLGGLDNHGARTEVREARELGQGVARRLSRTLDVDLLYVALRASDGVVRVATPLARVEAATRDLRRLVGVVGAMLLLFALAMSALSARLLSKREVARLAAGVQDLVEELARERDRFQQVLDGMRQAVFAVDASGTTTLANRAGRELLGVDEQALGPLLALPGPNVDPYDVREVTLKDGRQLMGHMTPDPKGGAVFVLHDVTRLRQLETIRRDFVANVSHELRTPVTVIQANAETLMAGALSDPERGRVFVEALARNAERLSALVSDLLDISRIESGQLSIRSEPVPVAVLAERAVEAACTDSGREVTVRCTVPEGLRVRADADALEQVLLNLVQNAVKYATQDGGEVEVTAHERGEAVRVEVRDHGPGIPPEHRDRVFERFYRIDPGRSKQTGGTGLGLSIVRNLVQAMDGASGVEANQPRGAVFWFELPRA